MEWVLLAILVVLGYVLGIVGFFQARRALREVSALRAMLAGNAIAQPVAERLPDPVQDTPAPIPEPPPQAPRPALPAFDIELLLTQRWGIWLGAVALLLAGVFLVRTAAEAGWLGPATRCALAGLLGTALLAGAEALRRRPVTAPGLVDQAPAALAAGALATWFAGAYGAGPLYDLLSPAAAFILLAAAGLAGLALSLRFGRLVAGVGLAASFGTPLLVQVAQPSMPGLFGYLLLVSAAAWGVVRYTAWTWLGWTAGVVGAAWVLGLALTGPGTELWPAALFVPAAAALSVSLLPGAALDHPVGRRLSWAPFLSLGCAGLLLAASSGAPVARVGVLLLSPVAVAAGWAEPRLARLPWLSALLFLAVLLTWALPEWQATGETLTIEGVVQAVLPGAWVPGAIQPLLLTGGGMAALYAAAGLWLERRSSRPLPWAALAAAVPVLALAVLYAEVGRFQPDAAWAAVALALAAGLVAAAEAARRVPDLQRAGVHAAGAVAALALGCAMLLSAQWLTLAVALFLPPLAWIEARAELPPLRRVALVVAAVVLARLVLNPFVLDYAVGTTPVLNGVLLAYGGPAACFALAAALFRRRAEDALLTVLAGGACLFTALLVALEIRHAATGGTMWTADPGFAELALQVSGLGLCALLFGRLGRALRLRVLDRAGWIAGGVALLGGVGLILFNPALTGAAVGRSLLWNALLPAYAVPAVLAAFGYRGVRRRGLAVYGLLAAFTWITLLVRQAFHPDALDIDGEAVLDAELWAYSGAWLAAGAALMALGLRSGQRALRLAALSLMGLAAAKVFLVDMAGLGGLWRVLSFLGLGLSLIGLGAFYRRFVMAEPRGEPGRAA